jgi:hypothetical protein
MDMSLLFQSRGLSLCQKEARMDSAFYRPRAPDHKEIAAGNPHRQLQIKKKNGGKKPGTPDIGAAAQDKDPVGFEKFPQRRATKQRGL